MPLRSTLILRIPVYVPISTPDGKHYELFNFMISPEFLVITNSFSYNFSIVVSPMSINFVKTY